MTEQQTNIIELKKKYSYDAATPMMRQYLDVKFKHLDCLILFRMGDFYELFFDDAIKAANILGIAMAKRGKNDGEDIPMCGVPHHALESYLHKLIDEGYKIALCEQLETPEEAKQRGGYKAVVKRDVTRIVTPGTILEENLINVKEPLYLTSVIIEQGRASVCYVDITTAEFYITTVKLNALQAYLTQINPKEILISEKIQLDQYNFNIISLFREKLVYQVDSYFDFNKAERNIKDFYNIQNIAALGDLEKSQISAIGVILEYLKLTQKSNLPKLPFPRYINNNDYMLIDSATRRNLEITRTLQGEFKGSLLSVIDQTITKSGARLLHNYLSMPLLNIKIIERRLQLTDFFSNNLFLVDKIRELLKNSADLERCLTRISTGKALPRDLLHIRASLEVATDIKNVIIDRFALNFPEIINKIMDNLTPNIQVYEKICASIKEDPANNLNDGGIIKSSYHPKIQELREIMSNSHIIIDKLRDKYRKETSIDNLKINHNNVLGFFIEVTPKNAAKITNPDFIHKQTLMNNVRYITDELKQAELTIINAHTSIIGLEQQLFNEVCQFIGQFDSELRLVAKNLAIIDVFCNFAYIAEEFHWCKPQISEDQEFNLEKARHAVVEYSLKKQNKNFIANDCNLQPEQRLWLMTGPNMAGKSTFLRQNAIIAILAQIGSFVPAAKAQIGIIDKLFSRIGASDELSKGQSTFMVEMVETAAILTQATEKSLIILDEVGRGTSTYDGVSIAWACLEYIHNKIKCRCLFATHYHELTGLENQLTNLVNYTIKIEEENGTVNFLHQIIKGAADRSYGIHVASIAGLPQEVINRAENVLTSLESEHLQISQSSGEDKANYNLQSEVSNLKQQNKKLENLITQINQFNPDEFSPKEALEYLYKIKQKSIIADPK